MTHRLRLKIGPIEIEYEGEEAIQHRDLMELASAAAELYHEKSLQRPKNIDSHVSASSRLEIRGSTASIASRLNCISGPELIIAAAARITFVDGEEWFDPPRLLDEMRKATAHYDANYQKSLASDIKVLVKSGKLVEVSDRLYALSATMRRELQRTLAE